jgi:DNA-binding transcriptional LysR family regulator
MDRLDAMSVFVQTVDSGSLSAAARKLSMPLTTVSRRLAELEAHLGAPLLIRSTRKLALTEAGRGYLATCRQILDLVGAAESGMARVHQQPRGLVTMTAPLVFGRIVLVPMLTELLSEFAEIDLRLLLGDRNLDLIDEQVDLALRIGALPSTSLRAVQVGSVREVVCASPEHFARHGMPSRPEDLQHHPCITFSAIEDARHWDFARDGRRHSVPIRSRLIVNTAEAAIDAAIAGVGVTRVLSYQVRDAIHRGRLVIALPDDEAPEIPVSLLFPGATPMPPKLRVTIDHLVPKLRAWLVGPSTGSAGQEHSR